MDRTQLRVRVRVRVKVRVRANVPQVRTDQKRTRVRPFNCHDECDKHTYWQYLHSKKLGLKYTYLQSLQDSQSAGLLEIFSRDCSLYTRFDMELPGVHLKNKVALNNQYSIVYFE